MSVQVRIPEQKMDLLADLLVELTAEIDKRDPDIVAHGFLGGQHGYGAEFRNDVFEMRPFYWGDCDCGHDERSEKWWAEHPHAPDCYQTELRERMRQYDSDSGYAKIDRALHGDGHDFFSGMDVESTPIEMDGRIVGSAMMAAPRKDDLMEHWRAAYRKRQEFEVRLYDELCKKYGQDRRRGAAVHCTCGVQRLAERATELDHHPDCSLELPNFKHFKTGFEVRWYKYIGRGMEVTKNVDVLGVMTECVNSVKMA